MSLRICILETDILRPELVDQYQGYGRMFERLFERQGNDFQRFYAEVKTLAALMRSSSVVSMVATALCQAWLGGGVFLAKVVDLADPDGRVFRLVYGDEQLEGDEIDTAHGVSISCLAK